MKTILAGIIAISLLFSSCSFKEVSVGKVKQLEVNELSLKGVNLNLLIPIKNDNNFQFRITKVDLKVMVNGIELGKVVDTKNKVIPANSNNDHEFNLSVKFKTVLSDAAELFKTLRKRKADVRIVGNIKVKKFLLTKNIKVDEKNPVDIFKGQVNY